MPELRRIAPEDLEGIPGLHFLTHVGELHSEETPRGSLHTVHAIVRVPSDAPIMQGRTEMSHVVFVEASNNLSHWIENRVPAVPAGKFKVPTVFPRGMGLPAIVPDQDIPVRAEICFQKTDGRWRGEVAVQFFRPDGSLAESVNFPLVERL